MQHGARSEICNRHLGLFRWLGLFKDYRLMHWYRPHPKQQRNSVFKPRKCRPMHSFCRQIDSSRSRMLLCGRKETPRVKSEVRRRGNRNSHQQIDGCHRQVIGNGRPAASPAVPKIQKNKSFFRRINAVRYFHISTFTSIRIFNFFLILKFNI
jgi:hypothetical protein